jgi:hypothetical protein
LLQNILSVLSSIYWGNRNLCKPLSKAAAMIVLSDFESVTTVPALSTKFYQNPLVGDSTEKMPSKAFPILSSSGTF